MSEKYYILPTAYQRGQYSFSQIKRLSNLSELSTYSALPMGFTAVFMALTIIRRDTHKQVRQNTYTLREFPQSVSHLAPHHQNDILRQLNNIISPNRSSVEIISDQPRPLIQGILNVTPDSFSDGGRFNQLDHAVTQAETMIKDGADIIDIGGESTRPGADPVSVEQELERVIPVIEALKNIGCPLSIDSRNAQVMDEALKTGAHIINDVSALSHDPHSLTVAQSHQGPTILMHAQNNPQNMQLNPTYDHILLDIYDYFEHIIAHYNDRGLDRGLMILDPGIGFGKTVDHNLSLLNHLPLFKGLGLPLLLGASRKSFMAHTAGCLDVQERLAPSLAVAHLAFEQGVDIIRVHDVKQTKQVLNHHLALCANY